MKRIYANVNPALLQWAREDSGFQLEFVAQKLDRSKEELIAWEAGAAKPTLPQAKELAALYKRALAVFYLPSKPSGDTKKLPDFRRRADGQPSEFSPQLLYLIRVARERQNWISTIYRNLGRDTLAWVGSETNATNPTDLAEKIRRALGISMDEQFALKKAGGALRFWITRTESLGAFVFQSGGAPTLTIESAEASGLAICDQFAPFIMLNSRESTNGRIFTLAHELTHLWLGSSGISNLELITKPASRIQKLEQFCNRVAGNILMPTAWFSTGWKNLEKDQIPSITIIDRLASRLSVSKEAVARRALEHKFISTDRYFQLRSIYQGEWSENKKRQKFTGSRGPNPIDLVHHRAGVSFTRSIISAYKADQISGRDVVRFLNTKLQHLEKVSENVRLDSLRQDHGL